MLKELGNQMNSFDTMITKNEPGKIGAGVYIYIKA